jgi:ubiquinone/menaquinone biosynthesis C-methylase UbiE
MNADLMNVDPIARWYKLVEYCAFGRALERQRFTYLDRLADARKILILGEGDGRVLARLCTIAPGAAIDVIEISSEMIRLAKARVPDVNFIKPEVNFIQEDARKLLLSDATYDAILTIFFLDCFSEEDARILITRLARALKPGGSWLMTDFAIPPQGWRRSHARLWVWTMYRFFRIATGLKANRLPPIDALLSSAGLHCIARQEGRVGLMISAFWLNSGGR